MGNVTLPNRRQEVNIPFHTAGKAYGGVSSVSNDFGSVLLALTEDCSPGNSCLGESFRLMWPWRSGPTGLCYQQI